MVTPRSQVIRRSLAAAAAGCLGALLAAPAGASSASVDVDDDDEVGPLRWMTPAADGGSSRSHGYDHSTSRNGRLVLFRSLGEDMLDDHDDSSQHTLLHDHRTGRTTVVDVGLDEEHANARSTPGDISADGRYVVFGSDATNLADGRANPAPEAFDIYLRDLRTSTTMILSEDRLGAAGDGNSPCGLVSDDGRYVAFASTSTDLVVGDDNARSDVFLHDRQTGERVLVSRSDDGELGDENSYCPQAMTPDGRYVVYWSLASNLVEDDENATFDLFRFDRDSATTVAITVAMAGGTAARGGNAASISRDGALVTFTSDSPDIVPGDSGIGADVFLRDVPAGTTSLVSRTPDGQPGDDDSTASAISPDGRFVVYHSQATDLAEEETDGTGAMLRLDLRHDRTTVLVDAVQRRYSNGADPTLTSKGWVSFFTTSMLDPRDTRSNNDVYVMRYR